MNAVPTEAQAPAVSVIVPARNEEACLGACLKSLTAQNGVAREIIVVNDASTDRTREIASSFAEVKVVDAGPIPSGWTGKNNALTSGSRAARGHWLLFTDADTVHFPGSLAHSLAEAAERKAALLSYSPAQDVRSPAEKAIMPVIFAELASTYPPSQVSDPASPVAAANGQYLLISREAYDAVGGHAAVAGSLLEDVALARAVKASGRAIFFRFGGDTVSTRMYRSFAQLREGWTKNLALLFVHPVRLALLRLTEFALIVLSAAMAVDAARRAQLQAALIALLIASGIYARFIGRIRKAHFPWDATVLAIFGLPFFSYLLLCSKISYRRGAISWKGRTYSGQPGAPAKPMQMNSMPRSA
jgi:hypothetical protein